MAHNSVDLVEEDAADLQFPKDPGIARNVHCHKLQSRITPKSSIEPHRLYNQCDKELKCCFCDISLNEPFILCAECPDIYLCLACFANGREIKNHRNDHAYCVQHDNFTLFSNNWTAQEEKLLLDSVLRFGFGNWDDIGRFMETKSPEECRMHYLTYYIDGLGSELLPKFRENKKCMQPRPYLYNVECVEEPPRFMPGSMQFNMLAGYRAARSDFDYPYDANAESIMKDMNFEDARDTEVYSEVFKELHCGIIRAYNHRLRERWRRYKILRTHGLISPLKVTGWLSILDQVAEISVGSCLGRFMQLCDADNFTLLIESLLLEAEMRKYLFSLYNLRENGIISLAGGELYRTLKDSRDKRLRECPRPEDDPFAVCNLLKNPAIYGLTEEDSVMYLKEKLATNPPKRKHVPLDIIGMPGYEKLSGSERELCAAVRLIPDMFMQYRDQLIAEYQNSGSLRLADARKLIKIDVNKTRQIYDYLIKEGYIKKPT